MAGRLRVRFWRGKRLGIIGLCELFGFVCHFFAERAEDVEILGSAAVEAFGACLLAQELGEGGGFGDQAMERGGEEIVLVLRGARGRVVVGEDGVDAGEGLGEAEGEDGGVEALGAEDCLLGEGDAFDGEGFRGVGGLVDGDGIGAEAVEFIGVLGAGRERGDVLAGVLGGAGLAGGGAGSGGALGVGTVGGEIGGGGSWHGGFPISRIPLGNGAV